MATSTSSQPTASMSSVIALKANQIGMSAFGLGQFLQGDIVSNAQDRNALSAAIAELINRPTQSGSEEVYFTITLTNARFLKDGLLTPSYLGWRQLLNGETVTSPKDREGVARLGSKLLILH